MNLMRAGPQHELWTRISTLLTPPPGGAVVKKPAALSYGLEERPPAMVTWISALQHVGVCSIFMVYPLIIARQARLPAGQITNILQLGFLVLAIAALLQALPRGPIGSRLLAPTIFTGVYLAPSLLAVKAGGMPLVWGMTIFAGVVEVVLSRFWSRLRPFIPPESAGLVVFLVGTIVGLAALLRAALKAAQPGALPALRGALLPPAALGRHGRRSISGTRERLKLLLYFDRDGRLGYLASASAVGLLTTLTWSRGAVPTVASLFPTVSWYLLWSFDWSLVGAVRRHRLAAAMNSTAVVDDHQRLDRRRLGAART